MQVDKTGKELVDHGSALFPVAFYHDDFSRENVPWHWHEELEIGIVKEGEIIVAAGSEKYVLKPGDGFFINSGELHGAWSMEPEKGIIHSLVFHPRVVGGSIDSIFWQKYLQPLLNDERSRYLVFHEEENWQKEAIADIEWAWESCAGDLPGFEFEVRNALSALVFLIVRNKGSVKYHPSPKMLRDGSRIKQMLTFIQENYSEELSVEQIAQSVGISESEALRCFRSTIGAAPIQYLTQFRIQKAAELLAETEQKIVDIGIQCGFQDMSYFAKTFRRLRGCTPSEFRKKQKDMYSNGKI